MASCKFDGGKCHGAIEVKAMLRHNDTDPQMRAVAAKGNPDIDPAKSGLNVRLYGGSYAERSAKYDARIAELDKQAGANVRKDRTTGQLIEVPVPKGLPRSQYNAWMRRVVEIQVARYGAENVIAADGHWDEEHEYIDENNQAVMSRVHVQTVVVPVVDGRLCGKQFYSRRAMRELNNEVQAMSQAEFGVVFMDGSKAKGKKSTAQLKAESIQRIAEAEQKAIEAAQRASEALLASAEAEAARMRQEASEALQRAKELKEQARVERAQLKVTKGTLEWQLQQAKQVTPEERKLLDAAKRLKLKDSNGRPITIYDRLVREVRVEGINAPEQAAQQQSRGRCVDDLPDF